MNYLSVTKRDAPLVTLKKSSKDLTVYKNQDKIEKEGKNILLKNEYIFYSNIEN